MSGNTTSCIRGTVAIRTCDQHENLYITLLLLTMFGPDYYVPRQMALARPVGVIVGSTMYRNIVKLLDEVLMYKSYRNIVKLLDEVLMYKSSLY